MLAFLILVLLWWDTSTYPGAVYSDDPTIICYAPTPDTES